MVEISSQTFKCAYTYTHTHTNTRTNFTIAREFICTYIYKRYIEHRVHERGRKGRAKSSSGVYTIDELYIIFRVREREREKCGRKQEKTRRIKLL